MSNAVNRILTEQLGGRHAETFIGKPGEMFYDFESGALRIGDGVTPGGHGITESSPLESLFIGPWVYFERPDDQPDVVDVIAPNLIIKRDPSEGNGSLFNVADLGEGPLDSNGSVGTPYGTLWNTDGWQDFSNTTNRFYDNFTNAFAGGGWATVKHEWVMHDTQNNKYYAIRFLSWDSGNNGATGAFSYIRREINTAIYFSREDTNDQSVALNNGDVVDNGLIITRGNNQAIFNYGPELRTEWTNFNLTDLSVGCSWEQDTGVVFFEGETGSLLTALQQLKVGDTVFIDDGASGNSVQVETPWNPDTHSFTTVFKPVSTNAPTYIYMDLTDFFPAENQYNEDSPKGTRWNAEGHSDLSNLMSRQFMQFDDLFGGNYLGERIVGKELVMHDTINDNYYAITFTRWQQGSNNSSYDYPGFSYIRRKIDVNKLTSGLKFNDGTVQTTAYSVKDAGTLKLLPRVNAEVNYRYITPSDIGKVITMFGGSTDALRLPDGGTADFPVGATITIINRTGANIYLQKENNDEQGTIYGAGTSDSGTAWTIPDAGGGNIVTLIKIETGMDNFFNDWMLAGSGITVTV
jgi:hypothetical protein